MNTERKISQFPVKSPYHPETSENILRAMTATEDADWLSDLRLRGVEYLTARGLPTPKLEGWKFTNLIPLVKNYSTHAELNFVMKPVAGVSVEPIAEAAEEQWVRDLLTTDIPGEEHNCDPSMMHLANVFFHDGIVIDVAAGIEVAEPLMMDVISGAEAFSSAQSIIRLGANARLTIIEDHRSDGRLWKNILTRIVLGQGAKLTHVRIQEDSGDAVYTQATNIELGKDAAYEGLNLAVGGSLSRNQVRVAMNETGGVCHINARQATCGYDDSCRAFCAALRVQPEHANHPERSGTWRVSRQDPCASTCAEDSGLSAIQSPDPFRRGGDGYQAGTGDLCRRCEMLTRRDHRAT